MVLEADETVDGQQVSRRIPSGEAGVFKVRGPNYLTDKIKIPSETTAYELLSTSVIESERPMTEICRRLKPLREWLAAQPANHDFLVVNRAVPVGSGFRNVIIVSRREVKTADENEAWGRAWARFRSGDDAYRNVRLKYIAKLVEAPWIVRKAIDMLGGQVPVIMGNGYLTQTHSVGKNYYELDVDVSSSTIACQIAGTIISCTTSLTIQEGFMVQGMSPEELPERLLCGVEHFHADTAIASRLLRPEDFDDDETPPPPPPPKPKKMSMSS